jgi:hypothetical protein
MRPTRFVRRALAIAALLVLATALPALACGGLVTPNGTVNLVRTTTLAAYRDGVEHYITSFEFAGKGASEVGSIVPLPGVPTKVTAAGKWTLQRLLQEVQPARRSSFFAEDGAVASAPAAEVLLTAEIDALDITVLKGGGDAVGQWAREHGYFLPPDAPEVLDFYATRSPIFLAARFNNERAQAQGVRRGEGTPIHVQIPTPNPWVPLRILALGRQPTELIEADVFLLTEERPATLPQTVAANGDPGQQGLIQEVSDVASTSLLTDLRSDRGMKWLPDDGMWLTYVRINEEASKLQHDLAIDASGFGQPDPVAAGYDRPTDLIEPGVTRGLWIALAALGALLVFGAVEGRRRSSRGGGLAA